MPSSSLPLDTTASPPGQLLAANILLYVFGGPVRAELNAVPVADLDVATAADPQPITQHTQDLGMFNRISAPDGAIKTVGDDDGIVIATLHTERDEDGSRNPNVELVSGPTTDLRRRDSTIDAWRCDSTGATGHDLTAGARPCAYNT